MNAAIELLSPRLRLRQFRPEDAAALSAYRSLPEVARYQSWTSFTPGDARRLIAEQQRTAPNTPSTWIQLALTTLNEGTLIGDCGIHFLKDDEQVELSITLTPAYQGRGLAAEALTRVLWYVFAVLDKHRARAMTDAQNHRSANLFRRLGFRQEARFVESVWFKEAWGSEFVFALLKRDWQAAN